MRYTGNQPQPVTPVNPSIILDQNFAANSTAMMAAMGARNAAPPLSPSTHLINKTTGIIFPWTPALAMQHDVLENCDEFGNTDPAAWQKTVRDEQDVPTQEDLTEKAYASLTRATVQMPENYMQAVPPKLNEPVNTGGAQTLDKFLDTVSDEVTPESEQAIKQMSDLM